MRTKISEPALGGSGVTPPHTNRGGANPLDAEKSHKNRTIVDWLAFTSMQTEIDLRAYLQQLLPDVSFSDPHAAGTGYPAQMDLKIGAFIIGWIKFGASHGRNLVELTGGFGRYWRGQLGRSDAELEPLVDDVRGRLSRVDIALDLFRGEVTVEDALAAYHNLQFMTPKARVNPCHKLIQSDAPDDQIARTLYVGAPAGRKRVRIYDKGLQVLKSISDADHRATAERLGYDVPDGDLTQWVRVELVYKRDKDRPLTTDMLTDLDRYFAGAYPALALWIGRSDGVRPDYVPDPEQVMIERLFHWGRRAYGGLIYHARHQMRMSDAEIVQALIGDQASSRLQCFDEKTWVDEEGSEIPF